jgi:uncharacterized membrane protein YbhN (UPF0104 family)
LGRNKIATGNSQNHSGGETPSRPTSQSTSRTAAANSRSGLIRRLLPGLIVSLVCLVVVFYLIDPGEFVEALKHANLWIVLLGGLISLLWLLVRGLVWRTLLQEKASYRDVFLTLNEGYLLNNILPFRLGEVGRAFLLGRKAGLDFWQVIPSILVERAIDLALAVGLFLSTFPFVIGVPWARQAAIGTGIVVGLGLLALYLLARNRLRITAWLERASRPPLSLEKGEYPREPSTSQAEVRASTRHSLPHFWERARTNCVRGVRAFVRRAYAVIGRQLEAFMNGLSILTDTRLFLRAVGWAVTNWVVGLLQYYVLILAFFPEAKPLWAAFCLGAASLGIAAPSSPGAVGVFEAVVVGALAVFGLNPSVAAAFALVAHSFNYLFTGLIGGYALAQEGQTLSGLFRELRRVREE